MSKQSKKRTAEEMRKFIESHQASGLSIKEFCRQNDLAIWTFGYWRRQFRKIDGATGGDHFAKVEVTNRPALLPVSPRAEFKVVINDRIAVSVPSGFHADSLRSLMEVLSSC